MVSESLQQTVYYHGTWPFCAAGILEQGLRIQQRDPDFPGRLLGSGIYLTRDPEVAAFFGSVILEVGLEMGTRVIDAATPPDMKTIGYLKREFGKEIITHPLQKVLPKNKTLTAKELVALLRYRYYVIYEEGKLEHMHWKEYERLFSLLLDLRRPLMARGIHSYGDADTHMGLLLFVESRAILRNRDEIASHPLVIEYQAQCEKSPEAVADGDHDPSQQDMCEL